MGDADKTAPEGSLQNSLLLQCLAELSALGERLAMTDQRIARTETQNDAIIEKQDRADIRQDAADASRGEMHKRINEISVNVAGIEVEVEGQGKRLDALDPIVAGLKEAGLEQRVIRKVVLAVLKNGYARAGGAALAGGVLLHQWEAVRDAVLRILGMKVGGP